MSTTALRTPAIEPVGCRPRFCYDSVIAQIIAAPPGEWVLIDPARIDGISHGMKQSRLHQACRQRGLRIATVFRAPGDACYARLRDAVDAQAVSQ